MKKRKVILAIVAAVIGLYTCFCFYNPEYAEPVAKGYSILLETIFTCTN